SNDPNLEKIKHPRHDLNHGIALVGMALNPARPDRERTMREAPSPKEGVLEISNGESSLALTEEGLMSLQNEKGGITLAENGRFAVRNGNEELLSLFDELLSVLELLTVTSRSEGLLPISPTQKAKVINIRSRFKSFLLNGTGSNENGQDNANDNNNETDNNGGGETVVDENDREESVFKLLLQTEVASENNVIGLYGCNLRVCQAMAEIVAGKNLTATQIKELYDNGVTNDWEKVKDWQATVNSRKYIFTGIRNNGQISCLVQNGDMAIKAAMKKLIGSEAGSPSHQFLGDYTSSRFIRHRHKTTFTNSTGNHFTLTDTKGERGFTTWDPDPQTTEKYVKEGDHDNRREYFE
ncbi:MAG: hypothetical protein FWE37_03950, partial [Spirochaetaceae bacterium]|nr:hypothetical protein [Spirochaetaceae bacterium]